jgi:hypothetical protein
MRPVIFFPGGGDAARHGGGGDLLGFRGVYSERRGNWWLSSGVDGRWCEVVTGVVEVAVA